MTLNIDKSLNAAAGKNSARDRASSLIVPQMHLPALRRALTDRMSGPGGAYNIGNLIGLCPGITARMLVSDDFNQRPWAGAPAAITHEAGFMNSSTRCPQMVSATPEAILPLLQRSIGFEHNEPPKPVLLPTIPVLRRSHVSSAGSG
ncbi:hypothetical protein [Mesorhizobium sp. NZP2077]|uniref:hypothetical protein n=1 Tax=Mesorhizobium sp. NZP2077 TaxID=2483404 RepID=UPI001553B893|nr:hypothetical protein [Mesorhizobium sp. NZP2077]QKD16052.1 hypothetical protein HGP13_13660 [Mesorhizobium sp. NZP2077]